MEMSGLQHPKMEWDSTNLPDAWQKFERHSKLMFDGPLKGKSEKEQCSYILLWAGDRGRTIRSSWNLTDEESKKKKNVLKKIKDFVLPKANTVFARYKFYNEVQNEDSIDEFVARQTISAKDCDFGTEKNDEMIRDRIVFECSSEKVRERLIEKGSELTLEKAFQTAQSYEYSKTQMDEMKPQEKDVDFVRSRGARPKESGSYHNERQSSHHQYNHTQRRRSDARAHAGRKMFQQCNRCGNEKHKSAKECPAVGKMCIKCSKLNHFAKVCRSNADCINVNFVKDEDSCSSEDSYPSDSEFYVNIVCPEEITMSKRMYHPCHKLSVPSAKLFWCRHCMQMFEDAITRWKHSKQCRGNIGYKHKNQDGQVIQMYVKPDKVSYTTNNQPGQSIVHKAQVKKTSADLKCVICLTKFSSLDDMREHVKFPCHRYNVQPDSEDSDSDSAADISAATLKIRRVESLDSDLNPNTSTALAVLAEASKHVESLAHRGSFVNQGEIIRGEVTPIYPQYQSLEELTGQVVQQQEIVITSRRPFVREDLEPVVISIQAEDGQDIPEATLDTHVIQSCVRETVETLPLGQVVQVEINNRNKQVKYFAVGCNGTIHPVPDSDLQPSHREVEHTPTVAHSQASTLDNILIVKEERSDTPLTLQNHQDTDLVEVLCGNIEIPQGNNYTAEPGNQGYREPGFGVGDIVVEEVFSLNERKNPGDVRNRTNLEHSYQINQAGLATEEQEQKFQVATQVNQAQPTTFHNCSTQLSTAPVLVQSSGHVNQGNLDTLSSLVPTSSQQQRSDINLQLHLNINLTQHSSLAEEIQNRVQTSAVNTGQGQIQVIEVSQAPAVATEPVVTIDNPVELLNNLVYPYTQNVNIMASGEQLAAAEDWFGFAELSEEPSKPTPENSQLTDTCHHSTVEDQTLKQDTTQTQSDNTNERSDQNEVLVPIISTKSGIKKFKVLARQKVEDDVITTDDEKDKDLEEDSTPITALKYVGNNTWRGTYNRFDKKFIPASSVRYCSDSGKVEITTEKIDKSKFVKKLVKSKSKPPDKAVAVTKKPRRDKGDSKEAPCKKKKKKPLSEKEKINAEKGCDINVQDNKNCIDTAEDIKNSVDKTEELKETGESDLIRNTTQVENASCDKIGEMSCSAAEQKQEDKETVINECDQSQNSIDCDLGRIEASMSPCAVKLKRDPSIDSLHCLLDTVIARNKCENNSASHQTNASVEKEKEQLGVGIVLDDDDVIPRRHSADEKCTTDNFIQRQTSMDESKSMVFNPDLVELRKSGRLKSAKCSSRYRGDYGIRAEIYNRLVHCLDRNSTEETSAHTNLEGSMCNEPCEKCETLPMDTIDNTIDSKRKLHISKESSVRKKLKVNHTVMRRRKFLKQVQKSNYSNSVDNTNKEGYVDNSGNTGQTSISTDNVVDLKTSHEELLNDGNSAAVESSKDQVNGHNELNKTEIRICDASPSNAFSCKSCTCDQIVEVQAQYLECTVSKSNDTAVETTNCDGCSENIKNPTCLLLGPHSEDKQICDTQEKVPYKTERKHVCDKISFEAVCHTECAILSESESCQGSQNFVQMETDCDRSTLSEQFCLKTLQHSDYVHSVGKSVNKKQNQISERKIMQSEAARANINSADSSPENSPNKEEPGTILEDLRMKLFQRAGASVEKSEKPKQFESKLISSKRKGSKGNANTSHFTDTDLATIGKDNRSGKSTPKSDSHVTSADSGKEIMEEVARTLGIFQQAKRKAERTKSEKTGKPKRQKFEQKTFLLRSMLKEENKACNRDETDSQITKSLAESSNGERNINLNSLQAAVITEKESTKVIESAEPVKDLGTEMPLTEEKTLKDSETQRAPVSDTEIVTSTKNDTHSKGPKSSKPKSIKCQACSHTFKSKELLRKHYPCRIRQTRTWSQNILRPNRPFKRNEKKDEKFRCKLPKSIKNDGKTRRQLLVPRKTKFRRVKGKRRRRLYQLLQELKEKRKIVQWPHLSVSYENLSYKEQCMYKLGLSCRGESNVGLDNFSQEDVLQFEAHKARQKEVDSEIFEHSPTDQEMEDDLADNSNESSMKDYSKRQNKADKITDNLNSGAQTNDSKQKEEPQSSIDLEQSMTDDISSHLDSSYNEPSLCDYAQEIENSLPRSEKGVNEIENDVETLQSVNQLDASKSDLSNSSVELNATNGKIQPIEKDEDENDSSCVLETNSVCIPELNDTELVEAQEQKKPAVLPEEPAIKEAEATLSSPSTPELNENNTDVNVDVTPNPTNEMINTSNMESAADNSSFLIKQKPTSETQICLSKTEAHVEVTKFIDCIVSDVVHLVEICKEEQKRSHNDTNLDASGENSHDYEIESNADMNSPDKEYTASMEQECSNDNLESDKEKYIEDRNDLEIEKEQHNESGAFEEASLELDVDFQDSEDTLDLNKQRTEHSMTCSDSLNKPRIECQNNLSEKEVACKEALNDSFDTYDLESEKHTDVDCGQDESYFESKENAYIEEDTSKPIEEMLNDDNIKNCSDKPEEAVASKGDGLPIAGHRDNNLEEIHSVINHIHEETASTAYLPEEEKIYIHCSDDWKIEINDSYSEDELENELDNQQTEKITMPCFPQDRDDQRDSFSLQNGVSKDSESALVYVPTILDDSTQEIEVPHEELTDTCDKDENAEECSRCSPKTLLHNPFELEDELDNQQTEKITMPCFPQDRDDQRDSLSLQNGVSKDSESALEYVPTLLDDSKQAIEVPHEELTDTFDKEEKAEESCRCSPETLPHNPFELEDELDNQQTEKMTMHCFPQDRDDQRDSFSSQDGVSQDSESALEYMPTILDDSTQELEVAHQELADTFDKEEKAEESCRSSPETSTHNPFEFETSQLGSIEEMVASVTELKSSSENSVNVNEADTNTDSNMIICYEQNGVTISENLLTGEKSVVPQCKDTQFTETDESEYGASSKDDLNKDNITLCDTDTAISAEEFVDSFPEKHSDDSIDEESISSPKNKNDDANGITCESDTNEELYGIIPIVKETKTSVIHHEENGVVMFEDLLTGEKMVVRAKHEQAGSKDESIKSLVESESIDSTESNEYTTDIINICKRDLSKETVVNDCNYPNHDLHCSKEQLREKVSKFGIIEEEMDGKYQAKDIPHPTELTLHGKENVKHFNHGQDLVISEDTYTADVLKNVTDTDDEVNAILRENTEIYNVMFTSSPTQENQADLNNSPYSISTEEDTFGDENTVTEINQECDINNLVDPAIIDDTNVGVDSKTCDSVKIDNHAYKKMKQGVRKFSLEMNSQSSEVEEMRSSLDASLEKEHKDISVFDISVSDDLHSVQSDGSESDSFDIETCQEIDDDDIHSSSTLDIEAPPILEKVVNMCYSEDIPDETFSEDSQLSSDEPPTLIPEEETSPEKTPPIRKFTEPGIEMVQTEMPVFCFKNDNKKQRPERHFLDVLGNVCQNDETLNNVVDKETFSDCFDKPLDDFNGRHFSDVIDNTVNNSKKLQSNLPINHSESGERKVTMAKLREILKPVHGNEGYLTTETLFKVRSDIVHLLKNVKVPVKKDPAWLKRDYLKAYSKRKQKSCKPKSNNNISEKYRLNDSDELFSDEREHSDGNEEFADDESDLSDWEEDNSKDDSRHSSESPDRYSKENDGNVKLTKGGITDSILQMLTSIEDKGNVAVNLSNLLDVLAQNFGFSGNSGDSTIDQLNEKPSDSDSDYSCTETDVAHRESVLNKGQEMETFSWVLEGSEPPSIDDIPLPEDDHITTQGEAAPANTPSRIVEHEPIYTGESILETCNANVRDKKETFTEADFVEETTEPIISKDVIFLPPQTNSQGANACDLDIGSSVIDDSSNKKKVKGSSVSCLFKSITELNTIETDDDFDIDSSFDAVSMSRQMCELKAFSENVSDTEVKSEISSISDNEELLDNISEEAITNTTKTFFGMDSISKHQTSSPKPHVTEFCEEIVFQQNEFLNDIENSKINSPNSSSNDNEILDETVSICQDESKPKKSIEHPAEMGNDKKVNSDEETYDVRSLSRRMTIVEVISAADEDDYRMHSNIDPVAYSKTRIDDIIITKTDETSDEEEIIDNEGGDFRKAQDEMDENFSRALTDIGILNKSMDNDVETGENSDSVSNGEANSVEDQGNEIFNKKDENLSAEEISSSAVFTGSDTVHKKLNECITPEVDIAPEFFGLNKSYDRMCHESSNKNKRKDNDSVIIEKECTCDIAENAETINKWDDLKNKTQVLEDAVENNPKDDINVNSSPMTNESMQSASEFHLSIEIRDKNTKHNNTHISTLEKEPVEHIPNSEAIKTVEEAFNQDDNFLEIKQVIQHKELEKEAANVDLSKPADNNKSNGDIDNNQPEKSTSEKTETAESGTLNSLNAFDITTVEEAFNQVDNSLDIKQVIENKELKQKAAQVDFSKPADNNKSEGDIDSNPPEKATSKKRETAERGILNSINTFDITTVEEAFNQDDISMEIKEVIENKELEKEAAQVYFSKPADIKTTDNGDNDSKQPETEIYQYTDESGILNSLNTPLVGKSDENATIVTENNLQILRKQTGDKALQCVNAVGSVAVEQVFSIRTERKISLVDAQYDSTESEVSDLETSVSYDAEIEEECSTTENVSSRILNAEITSCIKPTENDLPSDLKCVIEQTSAPFEENKLHNTQDFGRAFPSENSDSEKENVHINSSESHDYIQDCQEIDDDDIYFVEEHVVESSDAKPVDQSSIIVNEQIEKSISTPLGDIAQEGIQDTFSNKEVKSDDEDSNHTVDYNDPHSFPETLTAKEMNGVLKDHVDIETNSCSLSLMQSEKTDDHSEKENYPGQEIHDSLEDSYPDFQNTYFETIAEKVKRIQKERLLNQSHIISKRIVPVKKRIQKERLLNQSHVISKRIVPVKKQRSAVKEISVFRRSMLDKRLRQNSLSYANIKCPSRKKRERCSSLPKGLKFAPLLRNLSLDVKPCSVKLIKLSQSTIQKYIHPPRIERPPIKLKIKLSDIIMPRSPYRPYTYSSTEDETMDEMMNDSDKSPLPSNVSEHQNNFSESEEDIQEPPAVEVDNKQRSKSEDNVAERLKPLRIYLTDVMRMPKSKSIDFSLDLPSQMIEAQKQPKCSDNVSIARQIWQTDLQLSESDSDSDEDLREAPPSVLGKNDTAGAHKKTDDRKLADTHASSHAAWTDIKFQNTETKACSTDKTKNLIDALCEYEETTLFEDEQPSPSCDNNNSEGIIGVLNQHVENLLDSDLDNSGTITETVQSLSSPSEGSSKEIGQIETDEAAMRIQNEIFEEKTEGNGGDCIPDVYSYAQEVSNDVEICEAVHNLETVELGEVTATEDMTTVDYNNIQELERTPSYVKADYTTGKNVLSDNSSFTSEESGALLTRQSDQDIPNKYLYGISEESPCSTELIEEQVIEETVAEMTVEDEFVSITSYETVPTAQITSFSNTVQPR